MITLSPSVLSADFCFLKEEIESVMDIPFIDPQTSLQLHLDVMDGEFVPNISFGDPLILKIAQAFPRLPLDVHLMVVSPSKMIERIIDLPQITNITFHAELGFDQTHIHRLVDFILKKNKKASIALNPGTSFRILDESVVELLSMVLVMSVNPGFGGQQFIRPSLKKAQGVRNLFSQYNYRIQMDGGINMGNLLEIKNHGVENFVIGSDLFSCKREERKNYLLKAEKLCL